MITYSTVGDAALKVLPHGTHVLLLVSLTRAWRFVFQLIVCGDLLDNGELRLVAQPSVMCYEGSHWPWAIIAWLVVLLWVIGIPVFIFVFLRHKRRKNGRPLDENEHYRRGFGALFTPFSQRWYWFFAFNLMRRSVILGMSSLLFSQPIPRLFSLSCILAIFLAVHSWVQPFRDVRDNLGGLVILSVSAACMFMRECCGTYSAGPGLATDFLLGCCAMLGSDAASHRHSHLRHGTSGSHGEPIVRPSVCPVLPGACPRGRVPCCEGVRMTHAASCRAWWLWCLCCGWWWRWPTSASAPCARELRRLALDSWRALRSHGPCR